MKSKKGLELTLNTIIIAALALMVLVVLVVIFTGGIKGFMPMVRGCEDKYGSDASCMPKSDCESQGGRIDSFAQCPNPDEVEDDKDMDKCCLFATSS